MTQIVICRERSNWQDLLRDYEIVLDGRRVSTVSNGAEASLAVAPGRHSVQMKIDWCTSPAFEVNVEAGATVLLECGPNISFWLGPLYLTVWRDRYMWLRAAGGTRIKNSSR